MGTIAAVSKWTSQFVRLARCLRELKGERLIENYEKE